MPCHHEVLSAKQPIASPERCLMSVRELTLRIKYIFEQDLWEGRYQTKLQQAWALIMNEIISR